MPIRRDWRRTASGNPDVTEGGLMGEWLLEHGLSEDRLIIEDQAPGYCGQCGEHLPDPQRGVSEREKFGHGDQ